ncbi:MAG: YwqG family protein [Planctomycetota bacterium]
MNKKTLRPLLLDSQFADLWPVIEQCATEAVVMRAIPGGVDAPLSAEELEFMKLSPPGEEQRLDWDNLDDEFVRRTRVGVPQIGPVSWGKRSHFGGLPELPPGFEWPMGSEDYLEFVAQFDLSELPNFEGREFLPSCGMLSFFVDAACDWGEFELPVACSFFPESSALTRVSQHPRMRDPLETEVWARSEGEGVLDPKTKAIPPVSLAMQPVISLPGWEEMSFRRFEMLRALPDDRLDAFFDWLVDNGPWNDLQLLGEAQPIQNAVLSEDDDERLLLQLGSFDPYMWGDDGQIYIIAKLDDLRNHRFDRVRATWDGS